MVTAKRLFTTVILALMIFGLCGCHGGVKRHPGVEDVTIASSIGPDGGPLFVANDRGFITKHALNASIVPFASGRLAMDALLTGKAQVALVSETPLALAAFQGHNFYIAGTLTESPLKLVCLKEVAARSRNLEGKKIAVLHGTSADYWLYSYLRANHISPSDVGLINLQPPAMVAALLHGDVDGFCAWEPFAYQAQKAMGNKVTVISSGATYRPKFNVVVSPNFAKYHPLALRNLLGAVSDAETFMKSNRAASVQIVARSSGMDRKVLNDLWPNYTFEVSLSASLLSSLQGEGKWAMATGVAPKNAALPDYKSFIVPESVNSAGSPVPGGTAAN